MTPPLHYLIIDDEPIAHRIILDYASQLPYLVCVGQCHHPIQAMECLRKLKIDLIFLDLHMPEMKGFDFLKTLISPPQVVVTTAYEEYALQGFELNVVDYLLKPFTQARFLQAMQKVTPTQVAPQPALHQKPAEKLIIKGDKTHHYVPVEKVVYVEAFGNNCLVHTNDKTILTPQKISALGQQWQTYGFVRIHKSYLVSKHGVEAVTSKSVVVRGKTLPIGAAFRRECLAQLGLSP